MSTRKSVSELLRAGVVFEAHEAVAVIQQLLAGGMRGDELVAPFGPPTIDNVEIDAGGAVVCRCCAVTPAVSELGQLLDAMLPRSSFARIPGGLRYAIARARQEVDAPPFDSVAQFAEVLQRYNRTPRQQAIRDAMARFAAVNRVANEERRAARVEDRVASVEHRVASIAQPTAIIDPDVFRPARQEGVVRSTAAQPRRSAARSLWLSIGGVAAAISFSAGYVGVLHHRIHSQPVQVISRSSEPGRAAAIGRPPVPAGAADRRVEAGPPAVPRSLSSRVVPAAPDAAGPMFSPAFASNGTAIFYHTGRSSDARSALAERPLDDGLEVMTILDDGAKNFHVQPSPDGARIAFDSDRDGERGVYVAARDGSDVHRVSGPGYAAVPTWSPDGKQLAFIRAEADRSRVWNLWLTTLATSETRRLTAFRYGQTWSASWFPDGRRVAFTHEDRLAILDLADGSTRTFASPVRGRLVRTAAVSPDGRHVIFQVSESGAWVVDLSDGAMRCVLTDPSAEEFAWSPDGRRVAFHSRRNGRWEIFLMAPPQV